MAGKIRTVDIAKGHSAFCYAQFIESEQQRIFADMKTMLNALHPFREGNGRAIRVFLSILAMRHGYHLVFRRHK